MYVRTMKWSPVLHYLTVIAAGFGFLSLIGAWIAGEEGRVFGFTQEHFFNDAQSLFLLSIALGLGVLIHRDIEKEEQTGP